MTTIIDRIEAALVAGKTGEAIAIAETGAAQGDADALLSLAHWNLAGGVLPRDLPAARAYLRRAAELGHVDAALTEIALTANGTGAPADWAAAVALLGAGAARHGGAMKQQLVLLEAMNLDAEGGPSALPDPDIRSTDPLVQLWPGFLSQAECALVATSVQDILEPSRVADPRTGKLIDHPIRNSSAAPIGPTRESLPVQAILRRIAAATGTDVTQGESLTVLHYTPGQQYREHLDTLPHVVNQRTATAIIYLNEGYGGGETRFSELGLTIKARAGDALFFRNLSASGAPDPRCRHAGLPVTAGTKWVATRWIRAAPFDVWKPG